MITRSHLERVAEEVAGVFTRDGTSTPRVYRVGSWRGR